MHQALQPEQGQHVIATRIRAALNEFIRQVAKHFRHIKPADLRVILLHAGERLLPELPDSLARFAQGILEQRGVVIRCHTRLHGATAEAALLVGGERLPTRTLVSTVPTAPNPLVAGLPVATERGRIVVNEHLEVPGYPGVWAVGDGAWVRDAKTGVPCPPTAQLRRAAYNQLPGQPAPGPRDRRRQGTLRTSLSCERLETIEFIPLSFWYDMPLTPRYRDRRHNPRDGPGQSQSVDSCPPPGAARGAAGPRRCSRTFPDGPGAAHRRLGGRRGDRGHATGGASRATDRGACHRTDVPPFAHDDTERRIVKDRSRLWKAGVRDLVMELCCALHNFRVRLTPWQPMVYSG